MTAAIAVRELRTRDGFEPVWEPAGWWDDDHQAVLMLRRLA